MAKYKVSFPTPVGTEESELDLKIAGSVLTGTMTNPDMQGEVKNIHDGMVDGNSFSCKVDFSNAQYLIKGTIDAENISFNAEVYEQKVLRPGKRLAGKSGELTGEYLVGVYSPGGIKENHFVLNYENGKITGKMFCLADQEFLDTMKRIGEERPKSAPLSDPGVPGGVQNGPPMKLPNLGDKIDINEFYNGTAIDHNFNIFTKTEQGSIFNFKGSVKGDTIEVTMFISNVKNTGEGSIV